MDKYTADRVARHSGFVGLSYRGRTIVESHEWRRGQDRGKRRSTFGVYGVENDIRVALKKANENNDYNWNRFRDGNCMVW